MIFMWVGLTACLREEPAGERDGTADSSPTTDMLVSPDFFHDGKECVVTAPIPTCNRETQTVPVPPGAALCDLHEDCPDDFFCGDGACRPLDGSEFITFCLEEIWFEGEVLQLTWLDDEPTPEPPGSVSARLHPNFGYYGDIIGMAPIRRDTCVARWPICERIPALNLPSNELAVVVTTQAPNDCGFSEWGAVYDFYVKHAWKTVDGGCRPIEFETEGSTVTMWVSSSYP